MTALRRRRTAALGALVLAVLVASTALVAGPAPAQTDDESEATLTEIASCLRDTNRLLVLLLIDESGSLRQTDPGNERVTAAKLALQAFTALTQDPAGGGPAPSVEVMVAGFASTFTDVTPWTPLDARTVRQLELAVDGFATRNSGIDTDFPTALLGAQRQIAQRSQAILDTGASAPCKAILLFTDGRYDIETGNTPARRAAPDDKEYAPGISVLDPRNDQAIEDAGREFLCGPDRLADQLRRDRATLVTLALSVDISPADQAFLRALSTGAFGDAQCGTLRGARYGAYVQTADLDQLAPLFNQVVSAIGGGTRLPGRPGDADCATGRCVRASRSFGLDEVMSRFTATARTGSTDIRAELSAPGEAGPLVVQPGIDGEEEYGGTTLTWSWVGDDTLTVRSALPPDELDWVGTWTVDFVDVTGLAADADPEVFVDVFGAWTPELTNRVRPVRGEEARLSIAVVDGAGQRVSASRLRAADYRLAATVVDRAAGTTTPLELEPIDRSGLALASFEVPAELVSEELELRLLLTVATSEQGVRLSGRHRTTLAIEPPDVYPRLTTVELRMSSVRGVEAAEGAIEVVGGRDRAGCVWFGAPTFDSFPSSVTGFDAAFAPPSSEAECLPVESGARVEVSVRVTPRATGDGRVTGTLPVFLRAVGDGAPTEIVELALPIEFDLAPPINEARRIGLFLVILLAGVLGPILAVAFLNLALARFEPAADALVARVPVRVERSFSRIMRVFAHTSGSDDERAGGAVRRVTSDGGTTDLTLDVSELARLRAGEERSRAIEWDELVFQAEAPRNPFGIPYGTVMSRSPIVAGNVNEPLNREARIPLALPGTWVFVLDPSGVGTDDGWIAGELVLVLAERDADAQLPRVLATVETQLPPLANDLADDVREARSAPV